jgi:hypothetical protein
VYAPKGITLKGKIPIHNQDMHKVFILPHSRNVWHAHQLQNMEILFSFTKTTNLQIYKTAKNTTKLLPSF